MSNKKDLIDSIKNHFSHEIVDQYVLDGSGKKQWYKYCRNCKIEVVEKEERPTRDEQISNLQRTWAYNTPNIGQDLNKGYQGLDLDLEVPLEEDEDEYGVFSKRELYLVDGELKSIEDTKDHVIDAIRYVLCLNKKWSVCDKK